MAYMLTIDVVPPEGGKVHVSHTFYGDTEKEARETFKAHAAGCEFLTAAIAEDRIEEELDRIDDDERPSYEDLDEDEEEGAGDREDPDNEEDEE